MPDIVFELTIDAEPARVSDAIAGEAGIRGW